MFLLQNLLRVVPLLLTKQHKRRFQKRQGVRNLKRNLLPKRSRSLGYLRKRKRLLIKALKQARRFLLRDSKGLRRKKSLSIIKLLRVQSLRNLLLLRQVQTCLMPIVHYMMHRYILRMYKILKQLRVIMQVNLLTHTRMMC